MEVGSEELFLNLSLLNRPNVQHKVILNTDQNYRKENQQMFFNNFRKTELNS